MKYVAFASSPNQLIGIKEYIFEKGIKHYKIFIFLSTNILVNKELDNSVRVLKLKNIIKVKRFNNLILNNLKLFYILFYLLIKFKNEKVIFIFSDFLNTFFHLLRACFKKKKFVLIDDGFASFWIYKKYINKKIYLPIYQKNSIFNKKNKFLNFLLNYNFLMSFKFEFFTIFANDLKLSKKSLNSLKYCKSIQNKKIYYENLVYIIGTKYYENGNLSLEDEIYALKKIENFWKKKKLKIVYIAKRTTSLEKIKIIKKNLKINVIYYKLPLELALIVSNHKIPYYVCSFGSGLDKSLPVLFKDINSYLINIKKFEKKIFFQDFSFFFKKFNKNKIINL
jgi:hypothetical protein